MMREGKYTELELECLKTEFSEEYEEYTKYAEKKISVVVTILIITLIILIVMGFIFGDAVVKNILTLLGYICLVTLMILGKRCLENE